MLFDAIENSQFEPVLEYHFKNIFFCMDTGTRIHRLNSLRLSKSFITYSFPRDYAKKL